MNTARSLLSAVIVGSMLVVGCASPKAVVAPRVDTAPPPNVGPASGPPPDYVKPTNYWVRERIILTSEQEPTKSVPQKSPVSKAKKSKKTSKPVSG